MLGAMDSQTFCFVLFRYNRSEASNRAVADDVTCDSQAWPIVASITNTTLSGFYKHNVESELVSTYMTLSRNDKVSINDTRTCVNMKS